MAERLTTLAKRIRPFIAGQVGAMADSGALMTEGPGIDIIGNQIGIGGDTILLYNTNRDPVEEFDATEAGLIAALAAANYGDIVELPTGEIELTTGIVVGYGVTLRGSGGNETSVLQSVGDLGAQMVTVSGQLSQLELVRVNYTTANSASNRHAIYQNGDTSSIRRCNAYCTNNGSGGAYGHTIIPSANYGYVSFGGAVAINTGGGRAAGYAALTNAHIRSCRGIGYDGDPSIGLQARGAEIRQCEMVGYDYGLLVYSAGGAQTTRVIGGDAIGGTNDLYIEDANATASLYALQYDTCSNSGIIDYLHGDRLRFASHSRGFLLMGG